METYGKATETYAWDGRSIQEISACSEYSEHEKKVCEREYYSQLYFMMDNYIQDTVRYQYSKTRKKYSQDYCNNEYMKNNLMESYEREQRLWFEFSAQRCELSYFDATWGRGDEDFGRIIERCIKGASKEAVEQLQMHIDNGLESTDCSIPHGEGGTYKLKSMQLETKNFKVVVSSNCKNGLFRCDKIQYIGTKKSSGDSITLAGEALYDNAFFHLNSMRSRSLRKKNTRDDYYNYFKQVGYIFANGDFKYIVMIKGELIVKDGNDKILLSEDGVWLGLPAK